MQSGHEDCPNGIYANAFARNDQSVASHMPATMTRPQETTAATQRVVEELQRRELLLQAGREFASVANIVAGETIRGSWWAHPKSNVIYWVCEDLEQHPRVADARLLAGKVTHLWDTLWADVVAIGMAREPWQIGGLSSAARHLLERVDADPINTTTAAWDSVEKLGDVCRVLEQRLLVKSAEIHTESGRHAKVLSSWRSWWAQHGDGALPQADAARQRIEAVVGETEHRLLPWRGRLSGRASK